MRPSASPLMPPRHLSLLLHHAAKVTDWNQIAPRGLSHRDHAINELPFNQGFVRAVPMFQSHLISADATHRESAACALHSSFRKLQPLGFR
jgi:hypothetical protein